MSKKRKQPAAKPTFDMAHLPRQVGTTRARLSVDDPTQLNLGAFGSLMAPNYEQEWRLGDLDSLTLSRLDTPEVLLRLADLSPEVSKGLWDFLRFCNPGWEVKAYRTTGEKRTEDTRAAAVIDEFLARLKALYGSTDVVINRLFISAFLRGALFAEVVFDRAGRTAIDLATPDPRWVLFEPRNDPERGKIFVPYQQQSGQRKYLDAETVRYVPVDPVPGSPFGRALASPAVFTCIFDLGLLHDLRRVVAQQGYPRLDIKILGEKLENWAPPQVISDPAELKRYVEGQIDQIDAKYRCLQPEDVWIHTDQTELGRSAPVDSTSLGHISGLIEYLERKLVRALRSAPFLMGTNQSTTETQATRQYEALIAGIKAIQHLCEHLLEHLLALVLQAAGIQAEPELRFAEVRQAEMLRDAQVDDLKTTIAVKRWAAGFWSLDEASEYATGKKADAEEPRALPSTLKEAGGADAADTIPGLSGPDGEPAGTNGRSLLLDHELIANGNGKQP